MHSKSPRPCREIEVKNRLMEMEPSKKKQASELSKLQDFFPPGARDALWLCKTGSCSLQALYPLS